MHVELLPHHLEDNGRRGRSRNNRTRSKTYPGGESWLMEAKVKVGAARSMVAILKNASSGGQDTTPAALGISSQHPKNAAIVALLAIICENWR
jgi:hypothetical protein